MTGDLAWLMARHVCRTGYTDLPASAVESARRDILDTFGCMLGGSGSPGIEELFAVLSRWGGLAESRVLLHCTLESIEGSGQHAVRLGLRLVRGLANRDGAALVTARADRPFRSIEDL
jgi:hypothetical protein